MGRVPRARVGTMRRTLRAFRIVLMAYVAYGIIYRFPC